MTVETTATQEEIPTKEGRLLRLTFHEVITDNELFCQFDERHGVLLLDVKNPFNEDDFYTILSIIDPYFTARGKLRGVIINAPKFPYWTSPQNRSQYLSFAMQNHTKFKKVAFCMDGFFAKIVTRVARAKIDPLVKLLRYNHIVEAQEWMLFKRKSKRRGLLKVF